MVPAEPDMKFTFGAVLGGAYLATAQVLSDYLLAPAYFSFFQFIWGLVRSGISLLSELPEGSGAFEGHGTPEYVHGILSLILNHRSL
jgi:hypothetical protein